MHASKGMRHHQQPVSLNSGQHTRSCTENRNFLGRNGASTLVRRKLPTDLCCRGVDQSAFKSAPRTVSRASNGSIVRAKPQMLAHSLLEKQRAHRREQPQDQSWRDKPYSDLLEKARAKRNSGPMIARVVIDRRKAGQLSARRAQDPNWDRQKSEAFAYAEDLDTQAETNKTRAQGNRVAPKTSLRVNTNRKASNCGAPQSPAERIKQARGPRADVLAASTLDSARVAEVWEFDGNFIQSQFEGEKPGFEYKVSGPQGPGYYKQGTDDEQPAPNSPAQRIHSFKNALQDKAPEWAVSRAVVQEAVGRRPSNMISPIKYPGKKARPASAHPSTGTRTKPDVPTLQLGGQSIKPAGVQGLGLNPSKARPRSAAVSRVANRAASAWRQTRGTGTTSLW